MPLSPQPTTAAPQPTKAGRNLPAAIAVAAVLIAIVVTTLLWWNWGFVLFAGAMVTGAAWEISGVLERVGMHPSRWVLMVGSPLVIVAGYAVAELTGNLDLTIAVTLGALAIIAATLLIVRMFGSVTGYVRDAAAGMLGLMYAPLLGSSLSLLMAEPLGGRRIIALILVNTANDTGAYLFGSLLGRHKMSPRISPNKTWEGLAGGAACSVGVGAWLCSWLFGEVWWIGVVLGLVVAVFGTCGDLVESLIKRDAGLKDMSNLLPGHGGVLDRVDSLLVAAPVAWLFLHLALPGA